MMIIGRQEEKQVLLQALGSGEPEMVAVIGRRRVGKTFLVRSVYEGMIDFELVGVQSGSKEDQLQNFYYSLQAAHKSADSVKPKSWLEAFHQLITYLEQLTLDRKAVVFLDELPWLATHRSGFLAGLSYFWNSWASRNQVVVVICGSAASWMISKVFHHKGGLHNRVTRRIFLQPFTLAETEQYLHHRNVMLDRFQILQLYMVIGGIPHYLKEIQAGNSATQNIQQICFSATGILRDEFDKLYKALFDHPENHIEIIRVLSVSRQGLTHSEIVSNTKLASGGRLTKTLEELKHSGFIHAYQPFNNVKKDLLYRLTDEYSLFYLRFIQNSKGPVNWHELSQTQSWKSWSGYTFESVCLKHAQKLKEALGIAGIYSTVSSFKYRGTEKQEGVQIDMLIDRADQSVNLCEMKYSAMPITITKKLAEELRRKKMVLQSVTKTRKQIFITMVSTYGVEEGIHNTGLIDKSFTLDVLF